MDNTPATNYHTPNYMQLYTLTPVFKGEDDIRKAEVWIKKVNNFKMHYENNFNDQLFINGITHNFCGTAESWWNLVEGKVENWEDFQSEFRDKFLKVNPDEAWDKLKNLKQKNGESVEAFNNELHVLFHSAGIKDEGIKMGLFISALNENIAFELEKKRGKFANFEQAVLEAISLEKLYKKYNGKVNIMEKKVNFKLDDQNKNSNGSSSNHSISNNSHSNSNINDGASILSQGSLAELVSGMKQLNIHLVQQQQQIQQLTQQRNNYPNYNNGPRNNTGGGNFNSYSYGERKPFTCYNCGREGHAARMCPEPYKNNNNNRGGGSNTTEGNMGISNGNNATTEDEGKGNGRQ
ncbi:unnamed protein product [Mucor hiemalis]